MLKQLQDWLFEKTSITVNSQALKDSDELPFAMGLLIKLAESDGDFSPDESAKIVSLLQFNDRVGATQAIELFVGASKKVSDISNDTILKKLHKTLLLPQKLELIEMLYAISHADNSVGTAESRFINRVVSALGVSEQLHADLYKKALEARLAAKK